MIGERDPSFNVIRTVLRACAVFLFIGYFLYFLAVVFQPPLWALTIIEWFSPTVNALRSAETVATLRGQSPFLAQIVILYCAWGSIALSAWCTYHCFFTREVREPWFRYAEKKWISLRYTRIKLVWIGTVGISYWLFYPTILFIAKPLSTSWQAIFLFSSSFRSITFLLLAGCSSVIAVFGLLPLYFALTNHLEQLHRKG